MFGFFFFFWLHHHHTFYLNVYMQTMEKQHIGAQKRILCEWPLRVLKNTRYRVKDGGLNKCLKLNILTWVPRFYIVLYVHICICIICKMKNTQDANSMFKHVHLTCLYKNMFWVSVDNFVGSAPTFSANVLRASRVRIPTRGPLLIPPPYLSPTSLPVSSDLSNHNKGENCQ